MRGNDLLNEILARYPEEKPVVFNYTQAREELLSLAGRVLELEMMISGQMPIKENVA